MKTRCATSSKGSQSLKTWVGGTLPGSNVYFTVASMGKTRSFFSRDSPAWDYIIQEGTVEIVAGSDRCHLAELCSGEFFGELALLDDSQRTATAIARSYCKLLCLFQPDLLDLIIRNKRLGIKILFRLASTIGERLKKTNEYLTETIKSGDIDDAVNGRSAARIASPTASIGKTWPPVPPPAKRIVVTRSPLPRGRSSAFLGLRRDDGRRARRAFARLDRRGFFPANLVRARAARR